MPTLKIGEGRVYPTQTTQSWGKLVSKTNQGAIGPRRRKNGYWAGKKDVHHTHVIRKFFQNLFLITYICPSFTLWRYLEIIYSLFCTNLFIHLRTSLILLHCSKSSVVKTLPPAFICSSWNIFYTSSHPGHSPLYSLQFINGPLKEWCPGKETK